VRYAHERVDPFWAADLDAGLVLLATLVEQTDGATVGQATIGFERAPRATDVVRAFARQGIVATPIDATPDFACRETPPRRTTHHLAESPPALAR
jgi:hypothetical protein